MKLIILAFILSITLHFLFLTKIETPKEQMSDKPASSKKIDKSSVHFVKLQPKAQPKKQTKPKQEKVEPKKQDRPKKYKEVKLPKKEIAKREVIKKPKKVQKIPRPKVEAKPTFTKNIPKKTQREKDIEKRSLENFLLAEPVPLDKEMLDDITKSYINLYGEEYNSFTKVQKVFLQKNLKDIGRITQSYLRYPHIAVRTGQQGMNIVEFTLHPNGDITDLRISNTSGYSSLDENTKETIEYAYKDYPRPKTATKIKIYVYYKLY